MSAGDFYKVNHVILGGDMTGKGVVPVIREADGTFTSNFQGRTWNLKDKKKLEDHKMLIVDSGWYVHEVERQDLEELKQRKENVDEIFKERVTERIKDWIEIAEANLRPQKRKIIVAPGNDDFQFIDPILEKSDVITVAEARVLDLDGHNEMLSSGWSNPTPWNTPRECGEEELAGKIESMVSQVRNVKNSVFNLHAPPFGSGLDNAPKLSKTLQVSGRGEMEPVGSKAVLNAIRKHQPMLGLHGHIHEAMGRRDLGRTVCVNPGSNYTEGILNGVIVAVDEKEVKSAVFTSG